MNDLNNKVAIVTGASRGIGALIAKSLAERGVKVAVNYSSSKEAADEVASEIKNKGGEAIVVKADVSRVADVKFLFDETIAAFGKVDILINNAGIMINKLIADTTDEDFDKLFDINVKGVFNTLRESAKRLADNGSIVNFSTSANRMMTPTYGIYVASKSAVEQLTRIFAKEIGHRHINVNSISPGPTNTELFTVGKSDETIQRLASLTAYNRIGEPADIIPIVLFLVSDEAKWVNAQNIGVNGAMV